MKAFGGKAVEHEAMARAEGRFGNDGVAIVHETDEAVIVDVKAAAIAWRVCDRWRQMRSGRLGACKQEIVCSPSLKGDLGASPDTEDVKKSTLTALASGL